MKPCKKCGHPLPDEAFFCLYCETDQDTRTNMNPPAKKPYLFPLILAAAAVLLFAIFMMVRHLPDTVEGNSSATYRAGGTDYKVLVSFSSSPVETGAGQNSIELLIPVGTDSFIYPQLYAMRDGDQGDNEKAAASAEAFFNKVKRIDLRTGEPNNEKMIIVSAPERDIQTFPVAVAAASVHYYPSNHTVPLTWTIQMKNGDKIILHQDLELVIQETVQISYQDHEMETAEQLNELLDSLADLYPKDLLEITLPAVTYSEPVTIKSRGCTLYGSEEDGHHTTFTDTLEVFTRTIQITDVNGIYFSGNGGTGLLAHEGVFVNGCHFTGWDTAVYGQDGSWPMIFNSVFSKNTIGFLFDNNTHATCSSDSYTGNVFEDNETAVLLENIPRSGELYFTDNEFKNNVTDVTNNSTYSIVK